MFARFRSALQRFPAKTLSPFLICAVVQYADHVLAIEPPAGVESANLFGDGRGLRPTLEDRGISISLHYTGEVQANPSGGRSQGLVDQGLGRGSIDVDLGRAAGWAGAQLHVLGYAIHGESLTANHVDDLNVASNIDAPDRTRLVELWLQRCWWDERLSLRLGQLAMDAEFAVSEPGAVFASSAFGALPSMSLNLTSPIYPQGAPGVRLKLNPTAKTYVQAAAYQGNPGDPATDRGGTRWNFNRKEGALAMAEAGYLLNQEESATGLPGTYRIGVFEHAGKFQNATTGTDHRGQQGIYFVAQQRVYQSAKDEGSSVDLFARLSTVFKKDRSRVDLHFDGGANWNGAIASRPDDVLGVGVAYTRLSKNFRRSAAAPPSLDYEAILELTYQARINGWLTAQPDLQYILHPGGSTAVDNALVLGLRFDIEF